MIEKTAILLIILFFPFLMAGIIKKTKAFWGGRKGASVFQPLFDFLKLLKKDMVISNTTSKVFRIAPLISFASVIFAALLVPVFGFNAFLNIPCGIIVFAYTLGLGKFLSLISAMDTGSSFEGMGASREACFTSLVEPAFFITFASIMAMCGNLTFESLGEISAVSGHYGILITIFAVLVLFIMILIEGSRIPVDDPTTHLELTMIHEVMILDNSGFDLALWTWTNGIKMFLLTMLIGTLVIPSSLEWWVCALCYFAITVLISIIIGTVESGMARIRMSHVFEFVFIMSSLALVVLSLTVSHMFTGVN